MLFHDPFANRKSHTGAMIPGPSVQTFKRLEDSVRFSHVESDAVIRDRTHPLTRLQLCGYVDTGWLGASIQEGIVDQVLEQLSDLKVSRWDGWKPVGGDPGAIRCNLGS